MSATIMLSHIKRHTSISAPTKKLVCIMHSSLSTYQSSMSKEALVKETLVKAFTLCGEDASATVIPDGVSTLVE